MDIVVSELEGRGHTPVGKLIGFWEVMGELAEGEQFRGCPYLNTLVEIRAPDHPAYSEVGSYIDEVETYLSRTALEAGIHDAPAVGRQLRVLAMGTWVAIVFEASNPSRGDSSCHSRGASRRPAGDHAGRCRAQGLRALDPRV